MRFGFRRFILRLNLAGHGIGHKFLLLLHLRELFHKDAVVQSVHHRRVEAVHLIVVALQLAGDRARRQRDGIGQHNAMARFLQPAFKMHELRLRLKVFVQNHLHDRDIGLENLRQQRRPVANRCGKSAQIMEILLEAVAHESAAERIQRGGENHAEYADFRGPLAVENHPQRKIDDEHVNPPFTHIPNKAARLREGNRPLFHGRKSPSVYVLIVIGTGYLVNRHGDDFQPFNM